MSANLLVTYIGGPTALLEWHGCRLLTDPTFDPAGEEYVLPGYTLRKTQGPAVSVDAVGAIDVVLLSHDHHVDNLDRAGRRMLRHVPHVVTTSAAATRLRDELRDRDACAPSLTVAGLAVWESVVVTTKDGAALRITATPARHGPAGGDRGPVIGFILAFEDDPRAAVYVSGDTVWYPGVAEIARRFSIRAALLFMGAARVQAAGPDPLTLSAADAVRVAVAMPDAAIVPLHFEGWEHFSESKRDVTEAFARAGLTDRLRWLVPAESTAL